VAAAALASNLARLDALSGDSAAIAEMEAGDIPPVPVPLVGDGRLSVERVRLCDELAAGDGRLWVVPFEGTRCIRT
jgi:hypothetical protein